MTRAIDTGQVFRFLLKRWPLFAILLAASAAAAFAFTAGPAPDAYQATALIYCPGATPDEIAAGMKIIADNGLVIKSDRVIGEAVKALGLNLPHIVLRGAVRLMSKPKSAVYRIVAVSGSPGNAADMVNAMADAFVNAVSGDSGAVAVYEYAASAKKTIDGAARRRKDRIMITAVCLAGAVSIAGLYAVLSGRARSVTEAALYDRENLFAVVVCDKSKSIRALSKLND